eukprot:9240248-Pyramimonas_sp.AAC.1
MNATARWGPRRHPRRRPSRARGAPWRPPSAELAGQSSAISKEVRAAIPRGIARARWCQDARLGGAEIEVAHLRAHDGR